MPAAEIFIQISGCGFEFGCADLATEEENAILNGATDCDYYSEDAACTQSGKMNVFESLAHGIGGDSDAESAGEKSENVRGALKIFSGAVDAREALFNLSATLGAERFVEPFAPAERVSLLEAEPCIGEADKREFGAAAFG